MPLVNPPFDLPPRSAHRAKTTRAGARTSQEVAPVANLGTRGVVRPSSRCGDRRRVLLWHERGYDAGADGTATSRLPIV